MIQILAYRGEDASFRQVYYYQVESIPYLFAHINEVLENIPKEEHYNLHFTLASCAPRTRNFQEQNVIAFDIDYADLTKIESYTNTIITTLNLDASKTAQVLSGNGLHYYILVKPWDDLEFFNAWKPYYHAACSKVQDALIEAGLIGKVDPVTLAPSKTLRLPNTKNIKEGRETRCEFIQPVLLEQNFDLTKFANFGEMAPTTLKSYPPPDTKAVLDGCNFLKHCKENQAEVTEPEWYAALSILARLDKGNDLCHEYSSDHPEYDQDATQRKLEQALASSGPRICKSIESLWPSCAQCPHYGKVISPINIKGPEYIKTKDTGFHDVIPKKDGSVRYVPNFEDLEAYFALLHPYVTIGVDKQVYIFDKNHWRPMCEQEIKAFAQIHFDPKPKEAYRSEFHKLLISKNIVAPDWFAQSAENTINLANGVLDLKSMELLPHSPKFGHQYVLDYEFNPGATCPTFDQMMKEITLNRYALERDLIEFIGFGLAGHQCDPPKALLLLGEGANGKSTFLHMIQSLVGKDAYSTVDLDDLEKETDRYMLIGKLFNIAEEVSYKGLSSSKAFKALSAGGSTKVRTQYGRPFNYRNNAKFIFACNELPRSYDQSNGLMRRLMIVPFDATFDSKTADRQIETKLKAERAGILNRVIAAYKQFKERGNFADNEIIEEKLEEFKVDNNPVLQWFEERLVESNGHFITTEDLYDDFKIFCDQRFGRQREIMNYFPWCKEVRRFKGEAFVIKKSKKETGGVTKKGLTGYKFISGAKF